MTALLHAHSGLRYLVLLSLFAHLVASLVGHLQKQPVGGLHRGLSAASMGLLHTQALLGLAMVFMGTFYPQLIGHLVMMVGAATVATVFHVRNKRANPPTHLAALLGSGLALACVVGGVLAIGRGLFTMTVGK